MFYITFQDHLSNQINLSSFVCRVCNALIQIQSQIQRVILWSITPLGDTWYRLVGPDGRWIETSHCLVWKGHAG